MMREHFYLAAKHIGLLSRHTKGTKYYSIFGINHANGSLEVLVSKRFKWLGFSAKYYKYSHTITLKFMWVKVNFSAVNWG